MAPSRYVGSALTLLPACPASWALLSGTWTDGWIVFMILSELPSYLTDELGFDLESAGLLAIAPYAANFAGVLVFGNLFHGYQETKGWSNRDVRQVRESADADAWISNLPLRV